jgi:hypothetical protein
MDIEIFTERDIVHNEPPIVFTKPWFARGWVIGIFWASIVSGYAAYSYFVLGGVMRLWLILAGLLWTFTLFKYLKGVRFIEVSGEVVRVYARDVVTPIGEIPFERMTLVQDLNEIYFIRKAKFTGGFSLKKVYWNHNWDQMNLVFKTNASYIMNNYNQMSHGGFESLPTILPSSQSRGRGFGIMGAAVYVYEMFIGVLLWPFYGSQK